MPNPLLPNTKPSPFQNLTAEQIAAWYKDYAGQADSQNHWELVLALFARSSCDVEKALIGLTQAQEKNALASTSLSTKIWWLNVVLTVATVAAACVSIATYFTSE